MYRRKDHSRKHVILYCVHSHLFPPFEHYTWKWWYRCSVGHLSVRTSRCLILFHELTVYAARITSGISVHFTVMARQTPVVYAFCLVALLTVVAAVPLHVGSFNIQNFAAAKLNNQLIRNVLIQVSSSQKYEILTYCVCIYIAAMCIYHS